jgi:hypothetical protein
MGKGLHHHVDLRAGQRFTDGVGRAAAVEMRYVGQGDIRRDAVGEPGGKG